jgi:hypothetical protein
MKTLVLRSLIVAFTVSVPATTISWLPMRVSVADPPIGMYEYDNLTGHEAREKTQARTRQMSMFRFLVEHEGVVPLIKSVLIQSSTPFIAAFVSCMWLGCWQARRKTPRIAEPTSRSNTN